MDKKMAIFFLIFILAVLMVFLYLRVPAVQEKVASYTEEDFTPDNIYSDLKSISERLDEEIINGAESFTIYLKDMDVNEINQINESLDGVYGSGSTYQQVGSVGDSYKKITISIERTTNYYAVQAYLKKEPIPKNEVKAQHLYEVIKNILDTQISLGMTDYQKELALHDYLVTHCRYSENTYQPAGSDIYRAYGALVNQDAVCNGYAEALQILLLCAGIKSQFVVGTAGGVSHAWNLVQLGGEWYHLDATWNDPLPDRGSETIHPYFNVTDEIMEKSHTWEKEDYPAADSLDFNYYRQSNSYFGSFEEYKMSAYNTMVYAGANRYEAVIENYTVVDDDMQFIFENNSKYRSVSWQTFDEGAYRVLILQAE